MKELIDIINTFPAGTVKFERLLIKKTPHQLLFECYGVRLFMDEVFIMHKNGAWIMLLETQDNAEYIINSLLQRLKIIKLEQQKKK